MEQGTRKYDDHCIGPACLGLDKFRVRTAMAGARGRPIQAQQGLTRTAAPSLYSWIVQWLIKPNLSGLGGYLWLPRLLRLSPLFPAALTAPPQMEQAKIAPRSKYAVCDCSPPDWIVYRPLLLPRSEHESRWTSRGLTAFRAQEDNLFARWKGEPETIVAR